MSELEETLAGQLRLRGIKNLKRQHVFHPTRKWALDFAFPDAMLAVEVDGGTWIGGAHSRGAGQRRDAEKQNAAVVLGWHVMRATSDMVKDESAADTIEAYLRGEA